MLKKSQLEFIQNSILFGDNKPNGFIKTIEGWKYCKHPPPLDSFELEIIRDSDSKYGRRSSIQQ